jgi:hypothetical protein
MLDPNDILPVVIVTDVPDKDTTQEIDRRLGAFAKFDDVFQKPFEDTLVIMSSLEADAKNAISHLQSNDSGRFSAIYQALGSASRPLPSGPYFLHGNNIHQAWRLYADELDAFVFSVIPDDVHNKQRLVWPS